MQDACTVSPAKQQHLDATGTGVSLRRILRVPSIEPFLGGGGSSQGALSTSPPHLQARLPHQQTCMSSSTSRTCGVLLTTASPNCFSDTGFFWFMTMFCRWMLWARFPLVGHLVEGVLWGRALGMTAWHVGSVWRMRGANDSSWVAWYIVAFLGIPGLSHLHTAVRKSGDGFSSALHRLSC